MTGNGEQQTPQRLGKGMIVIAWILLLVLLTWFFNDQLDRQHNPNRRIDTSINADSNPVVQLQRNRFGHYVATGAINGHPVEFMLDTGATDVSIPAGIADTLGLTRGRKLNYQTANGTITAYQTTLDEIQLGPLRLGPVRASINPHVDDDAILLGMSFLKELDFSQQGNTLTLRHAQPGRP